MDRTTEPHDVAYRAYMRALGRRGGLTTKQNMEANPTYFREIGRIGAKRTAEVLRARFEVEQEPTTASGAPILTWPEQPAAKPVTHENAHPRILGTCGGGRRP